MGAKIVCEGRGMVEEDKSKVLYPHPLPKIHNIWFNAMPFDTIPYNTI